MKKGIAIILLVAMILTVFPTSVINASANEIVGQSSATNYDLLREYIGSEGTTSKSGYKQIITHSDVEEGRFYYILENRDTGIMLVIFNTVSNAEESTELGHLMEVEIKRDSKNVNVMGYIELDHNGTNVDIVTEDITIDRSVYTESTNYTTTEKGTVIYKTAEEFNEDYNSTLHLLIMTMDKYIHDKLGFGLSGLGFVSYEGAGDACCDIPSSYHVGDNVNNQENSCDSCNAKSTDQAPVSPSPTQKTENTTTNPQSFDIGAVSLVAIAAFMLPVIKEKRRF